ncbi:MAG: glycosyltransferase family 4 protein [Solirubrobacterales bacterium]
MSTLHVIGQLVPGGSEKMTLQVARDFVKSGDDHQIVALGECDESFIESLSANAVPIWRPHLTGRGVLDGFRARRLVRRLALASGVSVIQGHAWRSSISAGIVARELGIASIATLHRVYYPAIERWADRFLQHLWDSVVVDSQAVRELLVRDVGIARGRIEVIPNFVADEMFGVAPPQDRDRRISVLMAAHFTEVKGHRFAIEALALLEQRQPGRFTLDLLGEGPLLDESRDRVAHHGLEAVIRFHGRRNDLLSWLTRADVVLLPSRWEGFGLILAEAAACGRPAIAFDVGGAREVIVHGETGLLVRPGDVSGLAGALEDLYHDAPLREQMGRDGRRRARQTYGAAAIIERYRLLYERLESSAGESR